ncbi:MAG: efflux RND transporter permease subunit [Thermoguttaceae bacterium]
MIIRIVRFFLDGPFSAMLIVTAILLGVAALWMTPREEDPQIIVPMADVEVAFPGHSPREVEELVTRPLERILWQLDDVEHVYSSSMRDGAMVTVRFHVGTDRDRAMVKLRDKIDENLNLIPDGVTAWRVIPVSINDVPILTLTLHGGNYTPFELRRFAEELTARLDSISDISRAEIIGGYSRVIRVEPIIENLAARHLSFSDLYNAIRRANSAGNVGTSIYNGRNTVLLTDPSLESAEAVGKIVVTASDNRIIRVNDVAEVTDAPEVPDSYVNYNGKPAVTIAFSKKSGVNAVKLTKEIIAEAEKAKASVIPSGVEMTPTRDQGHSANLRVNDLVSGMFFAVLTVAILIALTMGWRESLVVGVSVPVSFALALFTNFLFGYTLNRVTLFALILSLGLVVDDPIMNVDNIQRHIRLGKKKPFDATLAAVAEVLPPVILSTIAVIISFAPMFFITGMMGPYMAPMAINVPLTVIFSTVCALTFVPFMAYRLLRNRSGELVGEQSDGAPVWIKRLYARVITPFFNRRNAILLLITVFVLVISSAGLMLLKVPLKMLPYDNRDELQFIVKMPPGTTAENTSKLVGELEKFLAKQNEVVNFQSYIGVASPVDFNGLVRHYRLRNQGNQADIRINILPRTERKMASHEIALRFRPDVEKIAADYNADVKIVEVPPGPPVLATMTAEIYGTPDMSYDELLAGAEALKDRLRKTDAKHFTEIDTLQEPTPDRWIFRIDPEKAAANGITSKEITDCLSTAISGVSAGNLRVDGERYPLQIKLRLPYADRNDFQRIKTLTIRGVNGNAVQLAELGTFDTAKAEVPIMHKNLKPVVFVTAEAVGRAPGEMILEADFNTLNKDPLPPGINVNWAGEGEWEITLRVFRDLGIAFGAAMIGIFLLLMVQTRSFRLSLIMMCAIPLTIIGIAPGFYILNFIGTDIVGGYASPVFFTATGMIGMIALGGIVIRNSIVLLEFIWESRQAGMPLREAVLQSGAVRFRPIMLTALTTLMGAWPITLDPILSGLAWALIFGLVASTLFTMIVIPVIYMLIDKENVS